MAIVVIGDVEEIELEDGESLYFDPGYGLILDTDGQVLSPCEVLIQRYVRMHSPELSISGVEKSAVRKFFGWLYKPTRVVVDIKKNSWHRLGRALGIQYARHNNMRGKYHHAFSTPIDVYRARKPGVYKLVLPSDCAIDVRGFVWP